MFHREPHEQQGPAKSHPTVKPVLLSSLARAIPPTAKLPADVPLLIEFPDWFTISVAVALGLSLGSFLNVVIYRVPRGMSLIKPPSTCPGCGTPIRFYDNIPLFGYLLLFGKTRCCKTPISFRYPLVELLGGLLAWAIVAVRLDALPSDTPVHVGLLLLVLYLALGLGLIAASFIDLEHMYVPDGITIGGTVLGLASAGVRPDTTYTASLIGAVAGFLMIWLPFDVLYRKLRGRTGMAMGDAKLVMLAGAWFGLSGAIFALLAGSVQGTVAALITYLARGSIDEPEAVKEERAAMERAIEEAEGEERERLIEEFEKDPIRHEAEPGLMGARLAFGPFLALATLEYMFFGEAWLLFLFGFSP